MRTSVLIVLRARKPPEGNWFAEVKENSLTLADVKKVLREW